MNRRGPAIAQTIDTPDGPFVLVVDERGRVLASGWSSDRRAVLERIRPGSRPLDVLDGETEAAEAVAAY